MSENEKKANPLLASIKETVKQQFVERNNLMTFEQFLEMVEQAPARFSRSAYQYASDMLDYFGREKSENPASVGGFKAFQIPFDSHRQAVYGQGEIEREIYRILKSFARGKRADKLILLHGPNGSAKSSIVGALIAGLEEYSKHDEGALYRFNWIFPEERMTREAIGFTKEQRNEIDKGQSYALLPEDRIAARIVCPLKDSPLMLIPREQRKELLERLKRQDEAFRKIEIPDVILNGDLSPRNRQIFDTLLSAYRGDYEAVLRHVQVERYYVSERYKIGAVTIEPQMSVDARIQQITADRSFSSLPPVLQNLALYEPDGHLIQANHGLIEYSDLLKRPVEAYKYLLGTCEKGTINLDAALLYLDLVMIGSSNDKYLEGFKEVPDFTSFKARMELIRVPYLRNYRDEQRIYDSQLELENLNASLAPHVTKIVALWAVLTRLRRPAAENYPKDLQSFIERLNPLEKAMFYAHGELPDWLPHSYTKDFAATRGRMVHEFSDSVRYEGSFGASPREGKMILQNAVQYRKGGCVTSASIFRQIRKLIRDKSVFEWLRIEPEADYYDQLRLVELAEEYYISIIDHELKSTMDMVEETEHVKLMERYISQASAWLQKKKVLDEVSGEEREADERFLARIEKIIAPEDEAKSIRQSFVSKVGAYSLDHPNEKVEYGKLFKGEIKRLEDHYFARQKKKIHELNENLLKYMAGETKDMPPEQLKAVEHTMETMENKYGYHPECTKDIVTILMKTKYAGDKNAPANLSKMMDGDER